MTKSFKATDNQIKFICKYFKNNKQLNVKNPHLLFFVKTQGLTISIFRNKTTMLQGDEIEITKFMQLFNNGKSKQITKKNTNNQINSYQIDGIIGCDEVGVGDYFGPIVTCACYIDNSCLNSLKQTKIKDSKKLSDGHILQIVNRIKKYVSFEVEVCNNKTYNKLINKYKNSKIVLSFYHNLSLGKLKTTLKNKNYKVVMDQYVPAKKYYEYFQTIKQKPHQIDCFTPRAEDKYLSVACASIIARAYFLKHINKLSKMIGTQIPLGASNTNKIVKIGKYIYQNYSLQDFAKIHFNTITNKIID